MAYVNPAMSAFLDASGVKPVAPSKLDPDEKFGVEQLAFEEKEVCEALQQWAINSVRGRNKRIDVELLDRLEYLLLRAVNSYEFEAVDPHADSLGVGA